MPSPARWWAPSASSGATSNRSDLFQACQPIEEVARAGHDAPRFGALKPVGLVDPRTGRRPWAAVQLRAEDPAGQSYNLVGFQTNLTFPEQRRVFRMIPGLEQAEFARYGVMHRNTFLDAPRLLDGHLRLATPQAAALPAPVYVAGQIAGTEGYCEAMRSGLHAALAVAADLAGIALPKLPCETAFGALLAWATDPATVDYQPMHANFGIMEPLVPPVRNKRERYAAYAARGAEALAAYQNALASLRPRVAPAPAACPKVPAAARTKGPRSDRSRPGDARGAGLRSCSRGRHRGFLRRPARGAQRVDAHGARLPHRPRGLRALGAPRRRSTR